MVDWLIAGFLLRLISFEVGAISHRVQYHMVMLYFHMDILVSLNRFLPMKLPSDHTRDYKQQNYLNHLKRDNQNNQFVHWIQLQSQLKLNSLVTGLIQMMLCWQALFLPRVSIAMILIFVGCMGIDFLSHTNHHCKIQSDTKGYIMNWSFLMLGMDTELCMLDLGLKQ